MPSSGQLESTRDQLVGNATLVNLPDRRFLERMQPQARQEVRYGLHTSCDGVGLRITVLASGVMSVEAALPHAFVEDGRMVVSSEPETVVWSDTGEMALIPTRLGRRHLMDDVTAEMVVDAFLGAFGVHTGAAGEFEYSHWHRAMEIYAGFVAARMEAQVQIIHHLPIMTPYLIDPGGKSPLVAEATCHVYTIDEDDHTEEQIQYRSSAMKLQKRFMPEAMDLVLHLPTTVIRRQHRAMFHADPDGRSAEDHARDLTDHIDGKHEVRRIA